MSHDHSEYRTRPPADTRSSTDSRSPANGCSTLPTPSRTGPRAVPSGREAGSPCRPLFISPHLDDAAFSCGRLLASLPDPVVATVFAGAPLPGSGLTDWDRAAGFREGDDVVAVRRDEDQQALDRLAAWPVWLDFLDRQYAPEPPLDEVVAQIHRLVMQCEADAVFFPLGLFHSDHRLTRKAAMVFAQCCSGCQWFAYEDALYRRLPGFREEAVADLADARLTLRRAHFAEVDGAAARKREAISCYASQLRALARPGQPGTDDLQAPESYWQVFPSSSPDAREAS